MPQSNYLVFIWFTLFTGYVDVIYDVISNYHVKRFFFYCRKFLTYGENLKTFAKNLTVFGPDVASCDRFF